MCLKVIRKYLAVTGSNEIVCWRAPADTYKVLIGESSAQIELTGEVKVTNTLTEKP